MNENVNYDGTTSVSNCDIKAVLQANHWKLLYNNTTPVKPTTTSVNCQIYFVFYSYSEFISFDIVLISSAEEYVF